MIDSVAKGSWVTERIAVHSDRSCSGVALAFRGADITYAQLATKVDELSGQFRTQFQPRELIALWLPNCPELIYSYLAGLNTAVVSMPLNAECKLPELINALTHAGSRHMLISSETAEHLQPDEFAHTSLQAIWVISGSELRLLHRLNPGLDVSRTFNQTSPMDSTAIVLHTSGSSGQSKGVTISSSALRLTIEGRVQTAQMTADSKAVIASSLSHTVGLYQALALLTSGARFVLLESYDTDVLAESVNALKPSHLIIVVSAFEQLVAHPDISADSFRDIVFAAVGADRVPQQLQRKFARLTGRTLVTSYGMTELSWMLINSANGQLDATALGRPTPGVELRLLDEAGREVAPGEVGEIVARSLKAMTGYLNDPELTQQTLRNGWVHSGDLARQDASGVFWFMGRTKEIIVLKSGDTVSPAEIEQEILNLSGVEECIVVGIQVDTDQDASCSEVPWAFVRKNNMRITRESILSYLEGRISDYKLPHDLVFLDKYPQGVSGKISRKELRDWWTRSSCDH